MGISLDEIKNTSNQIIADAVASKPAITGIPLNAVEVPNLNAHKLQNKTLAELMTTVSTTIENRVTDFKSVFGRVNSINGVTPDDARDITIKAVGDIQVIPDVVNNELILFGHNGVNGMIEVEIVDAPDGVRKSFKLKVDSGYIEGPELMFFYNGSLKTNGKDYTFNKYTYIMSLTTDFPEIPDDSDTLRCFIYRNGAVNQGMLRMNYDEGTIDGLNTDFVFYQGELSPSKTLVFKNGSLLKAGSDYAVVNTDKIQFVSPPSLNSYLEFINLKPYGGILEETVLIGSCDGTNKVFDISGVGLTDASAFIWVNGVLQNRFNASYAIEDTKLTFQEAPADGSVIRAFKVVMDRNIISLNGLLPDNLRNIKIVGGSGVKVSTNYLTKSIEVAGPSWVTETITPAESTTTLTLANTPIEGSVTLWENGVCKAPSRYSVTDGVITGNGDFMANIAIEIKYQM